MNDPEFKRYQFVNAGDSHQYRRYVAGQSITDLTREVNADQSELTHGPYGAYLFDPRWKTRRDQILKRDAGSCVVCGARHSLQVHHRQYQFVINENRFKLPWEYADHLLITLCETCHRKGHNKYKVPILKV